MIPPTKCEICQKYYIGSSIHCESLEYDLDQLKKRYRELSELLEKIVASDGRFNDRSVKEYQGQDLSEAIYNAAWTLGCAVKPLSKLKHQATDGTIAEEDRIYLRKLNY